MGAAPDAELLARAIRNPGRLVLGPTSPLASFPYGGVPLGFHRFMEVFWRGVTKETRDPSSGRVVEVGYSVVPYPELVCMIEGGQWDEDMVQAIFSRATKPSQNAFQQPPESRVNGTVIPSTQQAMPPMLWASGDPTLTSLYLRRPLSILRFDQMSRLSAVDPAGLPVRIIPTPTADYAVNGDVQICRVEQMSFP